MEKLESASLNMIGTLGMDRVRDVSDVDAAHALDLVNVDLFPAGAEAGRVAARLWFKRFAQRENTQAAFAAIEVAGGAVDDGTHEYRLIVIDASGSPTIRSSSQRISAYPAAPNNTINLSGIPTGAGITVDIYRTPANAADLDANYNLVVAGHAAATYSDVTADAALGALLTANAGYGAVYPFGNTNFDQTGHINRLRYLKYRDATPYLQGQAVTSGGTVNDFALRLNIDHRIVPITSVAASHDLAALGDLFWKTRSGAPSSIFYSTGATGSTAATQPAQPGNAMPAEGSPGPPATFVTGAVYKYVFQRRNTTTGILSVPSSPTAALTITGAPGRQNINTSFGNVTGTRMRIYRTSNSGEFFQFVAEAAAGATTYNDTTPDESLSQSTVPFDVGAAGGFRYIAAHKGILFVGRKQDSVASSSLVRWSNSGRAFNFPADPLEAPGYEFEVNPDDGDEITGLYSFGPILIVFKRRKVFAITGDPPTGFRWDPIVGSEGLGCVSQLSIAHTPIGLLWLSGAGVAWMSEPGAKPILISDGIREVFTETQRHSIRAQTQVVSLDRPEVRNTFVNARGLSAAFQFQVQFSTDAFATIALDFDTETAAEVGYFQADNAAFPATGGKSLAAGQAVQVSLHPPTSGALAPVLDTAYDVRARAFDGASWLPWVALDDWRANTPNYAPSRISSEQEAAAFAVDYHPRTEYWLWIPTGGKTYCDVAYILNYGPMMGDGAPVWRRAVLPASSATVIPPTQIEGNTARSYMVVGSPDGLLYLYPWTLDGLDYVARTDVADADLVVAATILNTGITQLPVMASITAVGTSWPVTQYKLKGSCCAVLASDGNVYHALITDNTATVLTVIWLEGRAAPDGSCTVAVGGIGYVVESAWLPLGGGDRTAILRWVSLKSGPGRGSLAVTVRATDQPGEVGYLENARFYSRTVTMQVGEGARHNRLPFNLRGHRHQVRIAGVGVKSLWEIQQCDLLFSRTGART